MAFPIGATGFESSDPTGLGVTKARNTFDTLASTPLNPMNWADPFNLTGANSHPMFGVNQGGGISSLFKLDTWERVGLVILGFIFITVALVLFGKGTVVGAAINGAVSE